MKKIYWKNKSGLLHVQNAITEPVFTCLRSITERKKNVWKMFRVTGWRLQTAAGRIRHRYFPVIFIMFLRISFLRNTSG